MSYTFHVVRKDLLLILAVVVVFAAVFGVLEYMDVHSHVITTWSEAFYRFVLRQ
jgi:hypothetical protein